MIGAFDHEPVTQGKVPIEGEKFEIDLAEATDCEQCSCFIQADGKMLLKLGTLAGRRSVSVDVPKGSAGKRLKISSIAGDSVGDGSWRIRPWTYAKSSPREVSTVELLPVVAIGYPDLPPIGKMSREWRHCWSYGDVENNGVYYHPQLTHYAHQAFEIAFRKAVGLDYVDLSRLSEKSEERRRKRGIQRMTFPVQAVHQFMDRPMEAGDEMVIRCDIVEIDRWRSAVRAWVTNSEDRFSALVIWVRWAVTLPERTVVETPAWFPSWGIHAGE